MRRAFMLRRKRAALLVAGALVAVALPVHSSQAADRMTMTFSGYKWTIRNAKTPSYPGPNTYLWTNAYKDLSGALHLKYTPNLFGKWSGAEVDSVDAFGYGTYVWRMGAPLVFDQNVAFGLFSRIPTGDTAQNSKEIDIEVARWGIDHQLPAQYVVQPAGIAGHLKRVPTATTKTSELSFTWTKGRVVFSMYDNTGALISAWTFRGSSVPTPGQNHLSMNLWSYLGRVPSDGKTAEVVIKSFTFTPLA